MKKLHLFFLFFLAVVVSNAQVNNFLLYSIKGTVTVVENKTESPAKIGKVLNSAASLKVAAGAAVTGAAGGGAGAATLAVGVAGAVAACSKNRQTQAQLRGK